MDAARDSRNSAFLILITLSYSRYYDGEGDDSLGKTGLAVFYNGWGSDKGIISSTSYAASNKEGGNAIVQFEVPAYGYIGNSALKIDLMSGIGLFSEDESMFIPDNYIFMIRAAYQYTEDGITY